MMPYKNQIYRIEGVKFDRLALHAFCLEKLSVLGTPYRERDIWTFILKWIDASEFIEVKTSGSTSEPKTIALSKKHMEASAMATLSFFNLKKGDTALLCLPVKYIAGKMMVVRALIGGLDLYFTEPLSLPQLSDFSNIDFAAIVPMQLKNLLDSKDGKKELDKIHKIIVGGGFITKSLADELMDMKTSIWQTFGMTETITHIALRRINGSDASDWYHPLEDVMVSVNERDCLVIDYKKIGVSNLATNDLVELLSDGRFRILGRADNVVNSGGIKLFPETIESKLEGITERPFYLAGIADEVLGEKLVLFIEGEQLTDEQELAYWEAITNRLTGYEVPKEIIYQKQFNRTFSGKIKRQ